MTTMRTMESELFAGLEGPADPVGSPVAVPARARVPGWDRVTSVLGLGPIPAGKVVSTSAIVAEAARLTATSDAVTPAERVTRAKVQRRAVRRLERTLSGPVEKKIRHLKSVFARINLLTAVIEELGRSSLVGPDGEQLTPEQAQRTHEALENVVAESVSDGSQQHLISRSGRKAKEIAMLAIDLPVFLLAMLGLLNVSLRKVFAGDTASVILVVTAVVFAVLGTVLLAVVMRTMGRRHRRFKDRSGSVHASGSMRRTVIVEQVVLLLVLLAAATVMAVRLYVEGRAAEAPMALVFSLAAMFALLLGVSAYINYVSELQDGSDLTDRVRHLSGQILGREQNLRSLHDARALLVEEAGIVIAALQRLIDAAVEQSSQTVTMSTADRAITMARSYIGRTDPLPAPELRSPRIARIEEQASALSEHHEVVKAQLSADPTKEA